MRALIQKALLILAVAAVAWYWQLPGQAAPPAPVPTLPANFDNDFRFTNTLNLKGRLLFTAKIGGYERVLMLDLDKQRISKVIEGPGNNSFAAWSPDGTQVAFVSDRDGNKEIYLSDAKGKSLKRITSDPGLNDHPSWSPDGSEILYFSEESKAGQTLKTNIISYNLKSGEAKKLTQLTGKNSTPQLSPNRKLLAYTTNRFWPGWDVCIFNFATQTESCPLSGTSTYCRPAWSHDGNFLAYSGGIGGIDGSVLKMSDMSSIDAAGTSGDDYDLHWSRDDKVLIFAADVDQSENYNLYAVEFAWDIKEPKTPVPLLRSRNSLRYPNLWQPK